MTTTRLFVCLAVFASTYLSTALAQLDDRYAAIDDLVEAAMSEGQTPGAVVLVGRRAGPVMHRAYGARQTEPHMHPMEHNTVFDLASLTKPVATATSILKLVENGSVDLDASVSDYLPKFAVNGKSAITVRDLLLHRSGLIADNHLRDYAGTREESIDTIMKLSCSYPPGGKFVYSDVGYIVLGEIVAVVGGESLDQFATRTIFQPLKMNDTAFRPQAELRKRAAATEQRDGRWMVGEVHDPRAYRLDGIAGHAGLFSTASDLARYARMMLGKGELDGVRVLAPESVSLMIEPHEVPGDQLRTLGWDSRSKYSSNRTDDYSAAAFGHGGFTGTSMWIDPKRDLFVIVLCTRLHPDGRGNVNRMAAEIGMVAVEALAEKSY